jgi:hypothetical protein
MNARPLVSNDINGTAQNKIVETNPLKNECKNKTKNI